MDVSSLIKASSPLYKDLESVKKSSSVLTSENATAFDALLNSAMGMLNETEEYTNKAEKAELEYMLGLNDNVTDLMIAQTKANISLQYTVAVKNSLLEAYKEIMNLQF